MERKARINAGGIKYETAMGGLYLDTLIDDDTVTAIVTEMARRNLEPNDIVAAIIDNGIVDFELREPLSSQ